MKPHQITLQDLLDQEYTITSEIAAGPTVDKKRKKLVLEATIGTDGNIFCELIVTADGKREHINNSFSLIQAIEKYNEL